MFRFLIKGIIFVYRITKKLCNMTELQQITAEMHTLEARLQELNHKYNFDTNNMTADDYLQYENIQTNWDALKRKRDAIKAEQK